MEEIESIYLKTRSHCDVNRTGQELARVFDKNVAQSKSIVYIVIGRITERNSNRCEERIFLILFG